MGLTPDKKRVVGLFGHHESGKTLLSDALLKNFDKADRIGQRYLDTESIEKEKGASFSNHIFSIDKDDFRFYFFDTPGSADFIGDIETALYVVDNVVMVINASAGVEVTTERIWHMIRDFKKPTLIFLNQMDKDGVNFEKVVDEIKEAFGDGTKVVPLQVPVGQGSSFEGIVNLLTKKAYIYEKDASGKYTESDIPDVAQDLVEKFHTVLVEDIVENSEKLMEKYLEEGEEGITEEEIFEVLHEAYLNGEIVPILIGSAVNNIGVDRLVDNLIGFGVSPLERKFKATIPSGEEKTEIDIEPKESEPFVGLIVKNAFVKHMGKLTYIRILAGKVKSGDNFVVVQENSSERISHVQIPKFQKNMEVDEASVGDIIVVPKMKKGKVGDTVAHTSRQVEVLLPEYPEPMISKSIKPKTQKELDKVSNGLARISESDPTFHWEYDAETGETVISGIGTTHLDIIVDKLKTTFDVDVEIGKPKIAYRETIRKPADAEHKHKKQTGGHGQYGHVKIKLEPLPRGEGYEFIDKIVGGVIPKNFIPSVDKGIREAMKKGVLAGYPVVDVRVTLYDGSYHEVDSSDISFQIAAIQAFRKGMEAASPVILEPIMYVEVFVPNENTGDVMGEITARRGRPLGMESIGRGFDKVMAEVPLAEMLDFAPKLSSITSGKGYFTMKFSKYQEVPPDIQQKIIVERQRELEEQNK